MIFSKIRKNNVYPCKPQFYCIKVGFKGVKNIKACFRDDFIIILPLSQTGRNVCPFCFKLIQGLYSLFSEKILPHLSWKVPEAVFKYGKDLESNLNSSNSDGLFIMANSN